MATINNGHTFPASVIDGRDIQQDGRATMQITIELPEDIAAGLQSKWKDLPRAALESLALEA